MPLYQMPFEYLSWTGSSIPALSSYLRCRVSPSSIDLWQDGHIMIELAGVIGVGLVSSERAGFVLPIQE